MVSQEALVEAEPLFAATPLPLQIRPAAADLDLVEWAADNRAFINERLNEYGGILFRDFSVDGVDAFEQFISVTADTTLEYRERSSPRSQVSGKIYTSTDYPPEYRIFLHNENSYQAAFPSKIYFFCVTPPDEGGQTPIADCRKVFERIRPAVRERFAQKQVQYLRNYSEGAGLPWQTVFQTDDSAEVEAYCRDVGLAYEWVDEAHLRTRAVRPAMMRHPRTGEMVWFNHATFFHVSTLEPAVREALLANFAEEDLPNNTYYGDGSPIEPAVLDELRGAYEEETVAFPWQQGDLLMLDNILVAHSRAPYSGPRKIVVGMADSIRWDDVQVRK